MKKIKFLVVAIIVTFSITLNNNSSAQSADQLREKIENLEKELSAARVELAARGGGAVMPDDAGLDGDAIQVAEIEPNLDSLSQWIIDNKIMIRYSAFDNSAIGKPASFVATWPGDGEDSFAADVGVTWDVSSLLNLEDWLDLGVLGGVP